MKIIRSFEKFNEEFIASKPGTTTKPAPTTTPTTTPRPTRPGVVPTERPGTEDAPLAGKPGTTTKPAPTTTPTTTPRPTRPGVVPTERPGTEDAPLASVKDVVDRFTSIYSDLSDEEKSEINSYFEK
jgi:hypothetical protein